MVKRGNRVTLFSVPVEGGSRQMLLFADALTDLQEELIAAADGRRTVGCLAASLHKSRKKVLQNAAYLVKHGYLRLAGVEEIEKAAQEVLAAGRLDEGLQLYQGILELQPDYREISLALAELYERTAHASEAAGIYSGLAENYLAEVRPGDALLMARKAASLSPGNFRTQDSLAKLCVQTGRSDEAARIWRAYAMRLAGTGEFERALGIIDAAGAEISGNDTLLYAEAEILALMSKAARESGDSVTARNENTEDVSEDGLTAGEVVINAVNTAEEQNTASADTGIEEISEESDSEAVYVALEEDSSGRAVSEDELGIGVEPLSGDISGADIVDDEEFASDLELDEIDYVALSAQRVRTNETMVSRRYRERGGRLVSILGVLIILVLFAAGGNYYFRVRMHKAVIEAQGLNSLLDEAVLEEKLSLGRNSLLLLDSAKPPFSFMFSSEYRNQFARTELLVKETAREFAQNNYNYLQFEKKWHNLPDEKLAQQLAAYTEDRGISADHRLQALELYQQWLKKTAQRKRDLRDAIDILSGKSYTPQERFAAYRKILLQFPQALVENYPQGIRDLTVPTVIRAEIAGSGKIIPLQYSGGIKEHDGIVEVPADSSQKSYVLHKGYALAIDESRADKSEIVYPLTFEQLYVLRKIPQQEFDCKFDFVPLAGSVLADIRQAVFADRKNAVLVNLLSGEVLGRRKLPVAELNDSAGFALSEMGAYFSVLADGQLSLAEVTEDMDGARIQLNSAVNATAVLTGEFADLELGEDSGISFIYSNNFSADRKLLPLDVVRLRDGKSIWRAELKKKLAESITAPVISIIRAGWYFILVCNNGDVFVVMENGQILKRLALAVTDKQLLYPADVGFAAVNERQNYLMAGGRIYRLDLSGDVELEELWRIEPGSGREKYTVGKAGVLVYGGGSIRLLALNNGEKTFEYSYRGELELEPQFYNDSLVLALKNAVPGGINKIIALDYRKEGRKAESWDYEFSYEVLLLKAYQEGRNERLLVYTGAGRIFIFN